MGGGYFPFFTENQPQKHKKHAFLYTSQANGLEPPPPPPGYATGLTYDFNSKRSFLLLHINMSSLQAHIDELNDLLLLSQKPVLILTLKLI